VRIYSHWLQHPAYSVIARGFLLLAVPLLARLFLGWSNGFGYLSDLAIGSLLLLLLHNRPLWLTLPVLLIWSLFTLSTAELVGAVGRMPEVSDLQYLTDPQFVGHSTQGGGLTYPLLAVGLALGLLANLLVRRRNNALHLPLYTFALPLGFAVLHASGQYLAPSEAVQWKQFNLPHKLLAEVFNTGQLRLEAWLDDDASDTKPDIAGLSQLDLNGTKLFAGKGQAKNVLIVTLEGIPGAYIAADRQALHSSYQQDLMPRLSQWAERGMNTPDYVLHSHQTIRGLYAMLCGDYSKLDSGTPKGLELLNSTTRNLQCLPAQLRDQGFRTTFLQGAGLRFMAKDKIMPHMGFEQTLGRNWFKNKPYLEFPWGMDDKAYFEGALKQVSELRQSKKPWMLTLLTVGTHQPYSAPQDYLDRYPTAKQAAIGYLDDAVADFIASLEQQGVLKDTLVIVTSDESHGIDDVRLASAWGFNLILAPEQSSLPKLKSGVYGHVDLTASVLDYFDFQVPPNLSGRSLFRDYSTGREMMSYTNGLLRQHDGKGTFTECDFQQICRRYASEGFIADQARYLGRDGSKQARLISQRAALLDQSLSNGEIGQQYQFANNERISLKAVAKDDWADNLIGAQYLELPQGTHTKVTLTIRAVRMAKQGAKLLLKTKEFDRDVAGLIPALPDLKPGQTLKVSFGFDNLETRKAFSFHLLGEGRGAIEITDFSVVTQPLLPPDLLDLEKTEESAQIETEDSEEPSAEQVDL
jgi:phosphoglycerol transferase MdoB-like AlkP superfamily enzyme